MKVTQAHRKRYVSQHLARVADLGSGTSRLALAVILQAITDLGRRGTENMGSREHPTRVPIHDPGYFTGTAFDLHCSVCALNPDYVRETLESMGLWSPSLEEAA